jgi:MFS-type transporter involved in bile tolerance (Atg22 family)
MRATIIIILLLAVLPLSFKVLERYKIINNTRDLYLARASILFYVLGCLLVSVPNIGIVIVGLITFSFGAGFESLCRSLITSLVDQDHTGRLYAVISVVDTLGAFMAPLLMAGLFNLGLRDGGWLGLPFFGAACVMSAIAVVVWAVRLPQQKEDDSAGLLSAYTDDDDDAVSIHEMDDDLIDIDRA